MGVGKPIAGDEFLFLGTLMARFLRVFLDLEGASRTR
jgi:hypothetical protein